MPTHLLATGDLGDPSQLSELGRLIFRLALAMALGAIMGWQHERQGDAAGLRTHMLVAIGTTLFLLLLPQAGLSGTELGKVLASLLAGLGLLCAGILLRQRGNGRVVDLTSAGGIWVTGAIATAVGVGQATTAIVGTLFAAATLSVLRR
jgi:putative Mg2+ transporter-C (MgtC) family protein